MEVAGPAFTRFVELIELSTMDVYGKPCDALLEQLRKKVRMLGTATVIVHELHCRVRSVRIRLSPQPSTLARLRLSRFCQSLSFEGRRGPNDGAYA